MSGHDIGFVISQSAGFFPYAEVVTAKNVYLRFHGPAELYASPYSDEELKCYAKQMKDWLKSGHEVWAYFNNDIHGYATEDAGKLIKLISQK